MLEKSYRVSFDIDDLDIYKRRKAYIQTCWHSNEFTEANIIITVISPEKGEVAEESCNYRIMNTEERSLHDVRSKMKTCLEKAMCVMWSRWPYHEKTIQRFLKAFDEKYQLEAE